MSSTIVDIATGRPIQLADPIAARLEQLAQDEQEARLVVQVRNATIAECQDWIRRTARTLEGMACIPDKEVRRTLLEAANHYRSAANVLDVMRET